MSKAILTVDDSASMRQMLAFILKGAGYEVVQASSPDEAIAMALEREFDLVLTDQNMAGGDGIQFAAVGGTAYNLAKAKGLGHPLPLEWFTQNIRD